MSAKAHHPGKAQSAKAARATVPHAIAEVKTLSSDWSALQRRHCACGGGCPNCGGSNSAPPPIVHDTLRASGVPLEISVRGDMERRFGRDLSDVRVHTDSQAAQSAHAVNALAYTVGPHIAFGAGRYAPHTVAGRRTLAHELTHVLQQRGASSDSPLRIGPSGDASEQEAERVAASVATGAAGPVQVRARSSMQMLRRQQAGVTEAIADGSLRPVTGVHGVTFEADNCFGIEGCGVSFHFTRAYVGEYVPGIGENPRRGAHVLIRMNHDPACGSCETLEVIQVMRDIRKNARGELEAYAPPTLHPSHRRRSGWDSPRGAAASRGWRVDAIAESRGGYDATDPFYSHTPVGASGSGGDNAVILDTPWSFSNARNVGKQFQTCLICVDGTRRSALGCVQWGYYIDSSGAISFLPPLASCGETRHMRDAVQRWEGIDGNQPVDLGVREPAAG
jgi:hypothetical protein